MPLAAMTGEMGCLPLHYRLTLNMLKYHLKLENNECNITLSLVYKWCKSLALSKKKKNWCWSCMKTLSVYKGTVRSLALTSETPSFAQLRETVHLSAFDEWLQQLHKPPDVTSESGGKLVLYRELQSEPHPSGYIIANISRGRRWVMAACRGGCLPLAVETGRWRVPKLPLAERICQHCNSGDVEDLFHFILFCTKYNSIRVDLFKYMQEQSSLFISLSPHDKIKAILSSDFNSITSKFIYNMYKSRLS